MSSSTSAAAPMAIVRVKRKRTENPAKALVLSFKRSRRESAADNNRDDENDDDDNTANEVFRFTASAPAAEDEQKCKGDHLKEILSASTATMDRLSSSSHRSVKDRRLVHVADIRMRSKQDVDQSARRQRENLLLGLRAIDVTAEESIPDQSSMITCNGQPLLRFSIHAEDKSLEKPKQEKQEEQDYVFDYYLPSIFCQQADSTTNEQQNSAAASSSDPKIVAPRKSSPTTCSSTGNYVDVSEYFNNLIGVYPYNLCEDAIDKEAAGSSAVVSNFHDHRNGDNDQVDHHEEDEDDDDDEDSNAESNWRNEYPDEDDDFENRYDFYDQNYQSSDDEDEDGEGNCRRTKKTTNDLLLTNHMQRLKVGKRMSENNSDLDEPDDIEIGNMTHDDD